MNKNIPKTSPIANAETPSQEFCWTWVCVEPNYDHGMFYRYRQDAVDSAMSNFLGFSEGMNKFKVMVVNVTDCWNFPDCAVPST